MKLQVIQIASANSLSAQEKWCHYHHNIDYECRRTSSSAANEWSADSKIKQFTQATTRSSPEEKTQAPSTG
jgi:hypothetical protein